VDASASASANQAKAQVDVSLTPLQSPTTPAALVYNSDSVSVRPIIQARLNSANNGALPSQITAILTWNNGTPITSTYSTANSNPGDALTIAAQVPYPATATGRYTWKLEVIAGSFDQTTTGSTFVVANDNSPFGAGWTFGPTDHLVNIPADTVNNLPAGILRVYGTGGYRFYAGASLTSPANDSGTLTTSSGGGHVYTDAGGARKTFDANGNQTSTVSADGHRTTLFTYDSSGRLAGVSTPDGGVSSFGTTPAARSRRSRVRAAASIRWAIRAPATSTRL
jgi:YD repeat-containing protein